MMFLSRTDWDNVALISECSMSDEFSAKTLFQYLKCTTEQLKAVCAKEDEYYNEDPVEFLASFGLDQVCEILAENDLDVGDALQAMVYDNGLDICEDFDEDKAEFIMYASKNLV